MCGNGMLDPGEVCDDGNTTNGDGCDNDCTESYVP
jgi:cysteine-rich repeat protein